MSGVVAVIEVAVVVMAAGAAALGAVRWLRVAQREHYLPGAVSRFALRWWARRPGNAVLVLLVVAGIVGSWIWAPVGLVVVLVVAIGPRGLSLRGRTSKLAWTRRVRTLAGAAAIIAVVPVLVALLAGASAAVVAALATTISAGIPVVLDAALAATLPLERALAKRHVERATVKLQEIDPVVVAITGSYGKTTTKGYVRHLLAANRRVIASPASFNNRAGLARTVNEQLAPGTDVFVAEMGTYGPGEIRELCTWVQPDVAVITAIGPVHLERMGSVEAIASAKAEILERTRAAVLNVDAPHLDPIAGDFAKRGEVIRCSTNDPGADVVVASLDGALSVHVRRDEIAVLEGVDAHPSNVACAIGVALLLDVPLSVITERLRTLPSPPNRLQVGRSQRGVVVIDDTFNANPEGARAALQLLQRQSTKGGRRVLVTPGMVELGTLQYGENAALAAAASRVATDVVIIGHSNRRALLEGARQGPATVHLVDTRDDAVAWVRGSLGSGDVVLYENDLPDHYP